MVLFPLWIPVLVTVVVAVAWWFARKIKSLPVIGGVVWEWVLRPALVLAVFLVWTGYALSRLVQSIVGDPVMLAFFIIVVGSGLLVGYFVGMPYYKKWKRGRKR